MARRSRCAAMIASRFTDADEGAVRQVVVDVLSRSKAKILTSYRLKKLADNVVRTALSEHDVREAEVSVLFIDDPEMQALNASHRDIDRPTDVLAFAMRESDGPMAMNSILGDIVVSVETANRQADEHSHSTEQEISFLLIHGLLHLLGFDHKTNEQGAEMRQIEDAYRSIVCGEA